MPGYGNYRLMEVKQMKIGISDLYLNTLGGGEKYMLSIAEVLSKKHEVNLFWDDADIVSQARRRFRLDLSNLKVIKNIFNPSSIPFIKRIKVMQTYDVIFYLSDGSIPSLFAKKNIIHFQFPVNHVRPNLLIKLKMKKISNIICNSYFTKQFVDKTFAINSQVIYPPCSLIKKGENKKENIILTVGRFNQISRGNDFKKLEVMIRFFRDEFINKIKTWRLVLVVSFHPDSEKEVERLEHLTKGFPIQLIKNSSHNELKNLYQKAKIYWHAAGFGEDLQRHPERAEHFGIAVVEAMGAGAVPVVINAGGIPEIITHQENGYLWNNLREFKEYTMHVINDEKDWEKLSKKATIKAENFSEEAFYKSISALVEA